jgi:hypothetical protein
MALNALHVQCFQALPLLLFSLYYFFLNHSKNKDSDTILSDGVIGVLYAEQ